MYILSWRPRFFILYMYTSSARHYQWKWSQIVPSSTVQAKSFSDIPYGYVYSMDANGFDQPSHDRDATSHLRFHYSFLSDDMGKLVLCELPLDTIMDVKHNNYQYNKGLLANLDP